MAPVLLNQDSGKTIPLEPEISIDVGRGDPFDIHDRHVSHKQVRFTLLNDGRCFVQRLGSNPSLLHEKNLPQNKEIEVYDGDTVYLLAHKYPFKVILPKRDDNEKLAAATASMHGDNYYYDDTNLDEYNTQKPSLGLIDRDSEASGTETEEEEDHNDRKQLMDEHQDALVAHDEDDEDDEDAWLSSESSLLGGESWDDEDDGRSY